MPGRGEASVARTQEPRTILVVGPSRYYPPREREERVSVYEEAPGFRLAPVPAMASIRSWHLEPSCIELSGVP